MLLLVDVFEIFETISSLFAYLLNYGEMFSNSLQGETMT